MTTSHLFQVHFGPGAVFQAAECGGLPDFLPLPVAVPKTAACGDSIRHLACLTGVDDDGRRIGVLSDEKIAAPAELECREWETARSRATSSESSPAISPELISLDELIEQARTVALAPSGSDEL